ncbi:MAG: hypothetical protein WA280_13535 [Xanthobacteraceae bacterium]
MADKVWPALLIAVINREENVAVGLAVRRNHALPKPEFLLGETRRENIVVIARRDRVSLGTHEREILQCVAVVDRAYALDENGLLEIVRSGFCIEADRVARTNLERDRVGSSPNGLPWRGRQNQPTARADNIHGFGIRRLDVGAGRGIARQKSRHVGDDGYVDRPPI